MFPAIRTFLRWIPVLSLASAALALPARANPADTAAIENRNSKIENSDVRFSATLTPGQREQAGLTRLSADNVAVIDGLVRQDEAASRFKNNNVDHTRFSQRRTPRERELAGLGQLTPAQVDALDDLVALRIPDTEPSLAATITGAAATPAHPVALTSVAGPKPEVHGAVSFTYGWSKAGDSIGGDVFLTYDDPVNRYGVMVGYSTYRGPALPFGYYPYLAPSPGKR